MNVYISQRFASSLTVQKHFSSANRYEYFQCFQWEEYKYHMVIVRVINWYITTKYERYSNSGYGRNDLKLRAVYSSLGEIK